MENIIQRIKDDFDDINKISSILKCDYGFDPPASSEEISNWEKDNNIRIPEMYKSWLMLTKFARIMGGVIELFFPKISTYDKEDVYIGSLGCGSDALYFSKNTGAFYSIGDDIEEYEDFSDFLAHVYIRLEAEAEDEYGEEWLKIYDERFPES